jgi:hypothetical protein
MAIDLNNLPATWQSMSTDIGSISVDTKAELGPIFKLLSLAGVHELDVDLVLDPNGNKMLRIKIFKGLNEAGEEEYAFLMYGPLIFRDGKMLVIHVVLTEHAISDGRRLAIPRRESVTITAEAAAVKIKADIKKILDVRKISSSPSD